MADAMRPARRWLLAGGRRRRAVCATAALFAAVTTTSCTDDAATPSARTTTLDGVPVRADSTRGAGTDLGAGFRVAPGSALLGAVFPTDIALEYRGVPLEDDGFSALIVVTGDVPTVLDAYAAQAAAIGLPLGPEPDAFGGFCERTGPGAPLRCEGATQQGPTNHGRSVRLVLWRDALERQRAPLSHLFLHYSAIGDPPYEGTATAGARPGRGTADDDLPLPEEWPPLPDAGEPYEPGSGQTPLRVPPGAQLVAAPSRSDCGLGGSIGVFRVTGDPHEVLDAVSHQVASNEVFPVQEASERGAELLRVMWHQEGGSYDAQVVVRSDEPTWMMVNHCPVD